MLDNRCYTVWNNDNKKSLYVFSQAWFCSPVKNFDLCLTESIDVEPTERIFKYLQSFLTSQGIKKKKSHEIKWL